MAESCPPTLALLVQRESEIGAFISENYYTVNLEYGSFTASSEKFPEKQIADTLASACKNDDAIIQKADTKEKAEKAPALYDLTTLQRDANRMLGYTAQQTLDYLQALYEKKLCTYPRTDSRFLTDEMANSVTSLVLCAAGISGLDVPGTVLSHQVCNSKKVSDHHAIIPTIVAGEYDLTALPKGEQEILELISRQVLIAVSGVYRYQESSITILCGGAEFTANLKMPLDIGWKQYSHQEVTQKWCDGLSVGMTLNPNSISVKKGTTKPPRHYTEDLLLASMETAGAKEMPDEAERKGLGTPATRANILEKLVATGMVSVEQKEAAPVQSIEETEALYLVNDSIYLHVQQSDEGWDYTLYDKESMRQLDGGVLESATVEESPISRPLAAARTEIMELAGIKPETVVYADISILEKLQEAQITIPANYEKQFLETPGDMVAIYQLKPDAPHGLRFERFDSLKEPPDQLHYECTYALSANPDIPRDQPLEQQYQTFNIDRPKDFTGQSLSVSDIVALKRNGLISYHYCDWAGYKELDYFKPQDNYPPAVEQILAAPEPDPYCNRSEMLDFGYSDQSMYPISTDFALELIERNIPVYMLYADNTEAMAFDSEDLAMHQGFIGVTKEDWAEVKDTPDIVAIKRHFAVDYLQDKNEDCSRQLSQNNPLKTAEMSMEDDYGMIDGINPEESVIPKKSGKRIRRDRFCL